MSDPLDEMADMLAERAQARSGNALWQPPAHLLPALDKAVRENAQRVLTARLGPRKIAAWLGKQGYPVGDTTLKRWMDRRAAEILLKE
jgi:hypothetical protein